MTETTTARDDHDHEREHLLRGHAGRFLLTASLGWTMIQAGRLVLSPMLPAIRADLGISEFRAGIALTALWGLYALCQFPSGRISDRLSRMLPIVAGLVCLIVGFGALSLAPTYAVFVAAAAVVGVGAGLYPTPTRALLSDMFVTRRGAAFGLHTASGDLGGGLAAGLAVAALSYGTWRVAHLPIVCVLAAVLLSLHLWRREPYGPGTVSLDLRSTFSRLLANRRLRWLLLAYVLYAFTWQGAAGFLPSYLQAKGFSETVASAGFAALFLVGVVAKQVSGRLGDRSSPPVVAAGALLLGACSLGWLVAAGSAVGVAVGVVGFASGLMSFPPVMQAYLMDAFPDDSMGGDLGATRTIYLGLGSIGPTYVGFVASHADYDLAFTGLLGCLLVSAAIALVLARTR